jgi:hypothetical protein
VADLNATDQAGAKKRRSTRIVQAIPISVSGTDALGQPFKERTSTVMVNCHGCKYQSKHYVPKHSLVTLEIPRSDASTPYIISGRVIWVQRPRTLRELFQIGIEFDAAGNVWGIAFPPDDWGVEGSGGNEGPATPTTSSSSGSNYASGIPEPNNQGNRGHAGLSANRDREIERALNNQGLGPFGNAPAPREPRLEIVPPQTSFSSRGLGPDASIGTSSPIQTVERHDSATVIPIPASRETAAEPAFHASASPANSPQNAAATRQPEPPQRTAEPAHPPAESSISRHTPAQPVSGEVAREIDRLVSEARYSLHQVARHEGRAAVLEEMEATRAKVDAHLKEAVEQALASSISRVSEQALQTVIQDSAFKAAAIIQDVRAATQNTAAELEAQLKGSLQAAMEESASRAAEQAVALAAEKTFSQNLHASVESAVNDLLGNRPELPEFFATEEAARARAEQLRRDIEEAGERVRQEQKAALDRVSQQASEQFHSNLQSSLAEASKSLTDQASQVTQAAAREAERSLHARTAEAEEALRNSLALASTQARQTIEAIQASGTQEQQRAADRREELRQAADSAVQETRHRIHELASERAAELQKEVDRVINERAAHLEPALQESAQRVLRKVSDEAQHQLAPHIESAQKLAESLAALRAESEQAQQTLEARLRQTADSTLQTSGEAMQRLANELVAARQHAEAAQRSLQQSLHEASEAALRIAHERFTQQNTEYSAKLDETLRGTLAEAEKQWTEHSTEAQHSTFEALSKASDWYSKKAQTTMQASLEKAVEHSSNAFNDRAAEVSRKVASELDHYSRSYVLHAQKQIDEAAGEIAGRYEQSLKNATEAGSAAFQEEAHRTASNTLSELAEAAGESRRQILTELSKSNEASLAQFQDQLDKSVATGLANAGSGLEAQLAPLMQAWEAQRREQQKAWLDQLKGASDESIEQYKTRLENASNSWLLASATSLGRHSQAVIDTLAQTAEQRLRDTFSQLLGSMGDVIRQRLMGLSTELGPMPSPNTATPDEQRKKENE